MIALFDVGVLVALFDPAHIHHPVAHGWLEKHRAAGWATCPISEIGFTRVVSHPDYPGRRSTVAGALQRLQTFTESGDHHFWPDSTSLRRGSRFEAARLTGQSQVTTAYLLLLAVHHDGRLVTFEADLDLGTVPSATPERLVVVL